MDRFGRHNQRPPDSSQVIISPLREALPQVLVVIVKNVLVLGFGMTLGFPTILIPSLSGGNSEEKIVLDQDAISWIGSVNFLCVPLGCLLSGIITQPFGRIRSMQLVNVPFFAAWMLFHFSSQPWHVFLALCMTGFSGGLMEAPVITFVAEISQPKMRGALSSLSTLSIISGILLSFLLGTFFNWRTVALVNAGVPVVAFVLLGFVPESPYWLISTNKLEEAKKSLAWLRGWTKPDNVNEEYKEIVDSLSKNPMSKCWQGKNFFRERILRPSFLKPFFLISFTFAIGHFGNNPITAYAIPIFNLLQVPISSYHATIYIGLVQLGAALIRVFSIKYMGKRGLLFISLAGVFLSFLASGIYTNVFHVTNFTHPKVAKVSHQPTYSWVPLATLIAQAFFSFLCIKGLPWVLIGEFFNNDVRGFASGLSAAVGYLLGFLANKTFLSLVDLVTLSGVFWFYSIVAGLGFITLYILLPETEGKSLVDITDHFDGGVKLNNKIGRGKRSEGAVNEGFEADACSSASTVV